MSHKNTQTEKQDKPEASRAELAACVMYLQAAAMKFQPIVALAAVHVISNGIEKFCPKSYDERYGEGTYNELKEAYMEIAKESIDFADTRMEERKAKAECTKQENSEEGF